MDTHSFGGALIALDAIGTNRRTPRTEAAEDAYYAQHTPVEHRIPRIAPTIAVLCLAVVSIGLWLQ